MIVAIRFKGEQQQPLADEIRKNHHDALSGFLHAIAQLTRVTCRKCLKILAGVRADQGPGVRFLIIPKQLPNEAYAVFKHAISLKLPVGIHRQSLYEFLREEMYCVECVKSCSGEENTSRSVSASPAPIQSSSKDSSKRTSSDSSTSEVRRKKAYPMTPKVSQERRNPAKLGLVLKKKYGLVKNEMETKPAIIEAREVVSPVPSVKIETHQTYEELLEYMRQMEDEITCEKTDTNMDEDIQVIFESICSKDVKIEHEEAHEEIETASVSLPSKKRSCTASKEPLGAIFREKMSKLFGNSAPKLQQESPTDETSIEQEIQKVLPTANSLPFKKRKHHFVLTEEDAPPAKMDVMDRAQMQPSTSSSEAFTGPTDFANDDTESDTSITGATDNHQIEGIGPLSNPIFKPFDLIKTTKDNSREWTTCKKCNLIVDQSLGDSHYKITLREKLIKHVGLHIRLPEYVCQICEVVRSFSKMRGLMAHHMYYHKLMGFPDHMEDPENWNQCIELLPECFDLKNGAEINGENRRSTM